MARKGVYKDWLDKDHLILLRGWKMNGLTDEQIAANIGIAVQTLRKWKKKYSSIGSMLKRGKEEANYVVENKLFERAIKGNLTAIIFWLKNNYSNKYSDTQKTPLEEQLTKQQVKREEIATKIYETKLADIEDDKDDQMDALTNMMSKLAKNVPKGDQNDS